MKKSTSKSRMNHWRMMLCFVFLLCDSVFAQSDYAVLVQESPAGAGEIKPGPGVHNFGVNEVVSLTTVARPGWRFVYWLGEVSDPTANQTMVAVDGPKIIIAVFQRDEFDLPGGGMAASSGPESLTRRYDSISSGGVSAGTYQPSRRSYGYSPQEPPENPDMPPPVPDDNPDMPPPVPEVPEPTTMLLLGIGAWFATINRKNNKWENSLL